MTIKEIFALLNQDLSNEYAHWHFYMEASTSVTGLHRQELSEFFAEQAESEMKHVEQFRRLLTGLKTRWELDAEIASAPAHWDRGLTDPVRLLRSALEMEEKVVGNYVLRHAQAESLTSEESPERATVDRAYIALFLEDQILDSRGDADNILEMLRV